MDEEHETQNPGPVDWRHPVVLTLFGLCLLPEIALTGAAMGLWGQPAWRFRALEYFGFWSGLLHNWRPNYTFQPETMFLTYGFLHAGVVHFVVNMMTLFSLSPPLIERLGTVRFILLYTVSLIGGALGFALLSSQLLPMVGASGALFGLAGAYIALHYRARRARRDSQIPILQAVLGLIGLNLLLWWAMNGQLAWETHIGGFVIGWIAALLLDTSSDDFLT